MMYGHRLLDNIYARQGIRNIYGKYEIRRFNIVMTNG